METVREILQDRLQSIEYWVEQFNKELERHQEYIQQEQESIDKTQTEVDKLEKQYSDIKEFLETLND